MLTSSAPHRISWQRRRRRSMGFALRIIQQPSERDAGEARREGAADDRRMVGSMSWLARERRSKAIERYISYVIAGEYTASGSRAMGCSWYQRRQSRSGNPLLPLSGWKSAFRVMAENSAPPVEISVETLSARVAADVRRLKAEADKTNLARSCQKRRTIAHHRRTSLGRHIRAP